MGTYSADQIDWLRPPEVEGERGHWTSTWQLVTRRTPPGPEVLVDLHPDIQSVDITDLGRGTARLALRTSTHPLDPEGYPAVDAVLRAIDAGCEIIEINGSERDKWRPFR